MTRLTVSAELALVYVRMTVSALGPNVGEDGLGMALIATHALMHSAQGIAGAVVIKLGNSPNRFPAKRCMTILTRQVQISVRTPRLGIALVLSAGRISGRHKGQQQSCQNRRKHGACFTRPT